MGSLKIGWSAMGALLIAIVVIAVLVCARLRRDTEAAQERSQSGGSQAIETGWGHIKHTTVGEGSPVLLMHGISGGFDQRLAIARGNVGGRSVRLSPLVLVLYAPRIQMVSGLYAGELPLASAPPEQARQGSLRAFSPARVATWRAFEVPWGH